VSAFAAIFKKKPPLRIKVGPDGEPDEEQRYGKIDLALIRRMGTSLLPFKNLYILGCVLGLIHISMEMLGPKLMQWLINFTLAQGKIRASLSAAQVWANQKHVVWIVALWALVLGISIIFQRFTILIMAGAGERVQFSVRRQLLHQRHRCDARSKCLGHL